MSSAAPLDGDPDARLQHALDIAYRRLARRERTELDVRRHLEREQIEPETIELVLADLERQGLIDDERFARLYAEDRRNLDGWGTERIEQRLLAAGVAPQIVAGVAARAPDDELGDALSVLRQRMRSAPSDDRERERALGLLVRRGYALELAYDAVRAFEKG